MNGLHQFIGIGGQDGKGLERHAFFWLPALPQAGEGVWLAALEGNRIGLFLLGVQALPLVEGIGGHQAASLLQRLAVGGLRGCFLRAGVDRAVGELRVPGPETVSYTHLDVYKRQE